MEMRGWLTSAATAFPPAIAPAPHTVRLAVRPRTRSHISLRFQVIEAAKKRGAEKAKLTKSMIVLDVKPWDDETDLALMEAEVRAIVKDGLLWGASKLVPIGYGIKKMQITAVIEDAKVESMDAIIEEELVRDGESDNIQSIDIVSFNKL